MVKRKKKKNGGDGEETRAFATGELFNRYRIEAGLTVEDVGRLMNMSLAHSYNIFQGKRLPSLVYAAQLAKVLAVPPPMVFAAVLQDRPTRPQQDAHKERLERVMLRPPGPKADQFDHRDMEDPLLDGGEPRFDTDEEKQALREALSRIMADDFAK